MWGSLCRPYVFFCLSLIMLYFELKFAFLFLKFLYVFFNNINPNISINLKLVSYSIPLPLPFSHPLALTPTSIFTPFSDSKLSLTLDKSYSFPHSPPHFSKITLLSNSPLSPHKVYPLPPLKSSFLSYCVSFLYVQLYITVITSEFLFYKTFFKVHVIFNHPVIKHFLFLSLMRLIIFSFFMYVIIDLAIIKYYSVFLIRFNSLMKFFLYTQFFLLRTVSNYNKLIYRSYYVLYNLILFKFSEPYSSTMFRNHHSNSRPNYGKLIVMLLKHFPVVICLHLILSTISIFCAFCVDLNINSL